MKTVISALVIKVEQTVYNEAGQQMPRPALVDLVAWESQIPPEVDAWVRSLMKKES